MEAFCICYQHLLTVYNLLCSQDGAEFLQKYYSHGFKFLTVFPDGSAQILYPLVWLDFQWERDLVLDCMCSATCTRQWVFPSLSSWQQLSLRPPGSRCRGHWRKWKGLHRVRWLRRLLSTSESRVPVWRQGDVLSQQWKHMVQRKVFISLFKMCMIKVILVMSIVYPPLHVPWNNKVL